MKTEVDNYRGWKIEFDTDSESFSCYSSSYDREEKKKSYASVKKWIDDFVKENAEFRPIKMISNPDYRNKPEIITLVGVRKDGRFLYENSKGERAQLGSYDESRYSVYSEQNANALEEAAKMNEEIDLMRKKRDAYLEANFVKKSVKDIRRELGINTAL